MIRRDFFKNAILVSALSVVPTSLCSVDWSKFGIKRLGSFSSWGCPIKWSIDFNVATKVLPPRANIIAFDFHTWKVFICGIHSESLSKELRENFWKKYDSDIPHENEFIGDSKKLWFVRMFRSDQQFLDENGVLHRIVSPITHC